MHIDYTTVQQAVDEFNQIAFKKHGGYAFSAGYLGSMLVGLMADPTPYNMEMTLRHIRKDTKEMQKSIEQSIPA